MDDLSVVPSLSAALDHETHRKRAKKWRYNANQAYHKMVESPLFRLTVKVDIDELREDLLAAGGGGWMADARAVSDSQGRQTQTAGLGAKLGGTRRPPS